jgi:3-hydroxypropanoate dehydrogenase
MGFVMSLPLSPDALATLFTEARTYGAWLDTPVPDDLLVDAWNLARMGPTALNSSPLRVVFVRSPEAKAQLKPLLAPGNVDKTMAAPVTAIFGYDHEFYEKLAKLAPHVDGLAMFAGKDGAIAATSQLNGSLQAAYFMLALRSLGLDCGPMAGFNAAEATTVFFAGTAIKASFLCNIGYGDATKLRPRNARLDFAEVATVI